jgi:GT2 family glycosyltransferase
MTIAWEHGDPTPSLFPHLESAARARVKANKREHVYPHIDAVVVPSRFLVTDIGWSAARVIHNGADHLSESASGVAPIRSRDRLNFLSVCRLGTGEAHYKGVELYEAFRRALDGIPADFVLLGRGTDADKRRYEGRGFRVIRDASNAELRQAYAACDLYVSFSRWEGFDLPLVEAQAMGRPAFALDTACHREVCEHVFATPQAMATAVRTLSRADLTTLGARAREFVRQFTWERNTAQLLSLLGELGGTSARRPRRLRAALAARLVAGGLASGARDLVAPQLRRRPRLEHAARWGVAIRRYGLKPAVEVLVARSRGRWGRRPAGVLPRQPLDLPGPEVPGLVSICILTKDGYDFISNCLRSLLETTAPDRVEIVVGDTGSSDTRVFELYRNLPAHARVLSLGRYHFSANNNELARRARGAFVLFLNNDTRATPGWLPRLLAPMQCDRVGIVGPKLLFDDGTIQHAGVQVATEEPYRYIGWHPHRGASADAPEANVALSLPGVTGACLLIRRALFGRLGGFDERYAEECQDLDLCLQATGEGYEVVYEPRSVLFHFENGTRALRESLPDRALFRTRWAAFLETGILRKPRQAEPWDSDPGRR